jgi:tetratricopeptide (TPR) repeat protein
MLHLSAARAAARAGLAEAEAEHRFQAFRLAPDEAGWRRQALRCLRKTARWLDVLEVLREEGKSGNRFGATLEGAEVLAGPLGQPEAALPWAEEALRCAMESGRAQDLERARELLARLPGERGAAVEPPPLEAVQVVSTGEGTVKWEIEEGTEPSDEADLLAAQLAMAKGAFLEGERRLEEAVLAYEVALGAMPRLAEALERLSQVHVALGRREEALSCVERLLYIVDEPRARARIHARRAALALEREAALRDLRAALEGCGDDGDTLDLCAQTAAARDLPEITVLVEERRRRLGS